MTHMILRLLEDRLPGGTDPVYLPGLNRALYVVEGEVTIETATGAAHQASGSAWLGDGEIGLLAGRAETRLLRWELVPRTIQHDGTLRSAPRCSSEAKLVAEIDLDENFGWLMRCDKVGFPKGGIAYTHVHQGPGIRCCLEGRITIETQGTTHVYGAGEAWFELGPAPVLAPTSDEMETTFARCFVLPRGCKGRSSIRYVRPEDAAKPKPQRYQVLGERFIELGRA